MNKQMALVTGGSGGIGRAISLRLAKDGYFVLVHYNHNQNEAMKTAEFIESAGGQGRIVSFDVTDAQSAEKNLEVISKELGEMDLSVLVNNSGIHNDCLLGFMSD